MMSCRSDAQAAARRRPRSAADRCDPDRRGRPGSWPRAQYLEDSDQHGLDTGRPSASGRGLSSTNVTDHYSPVRVKVESESLRVIPSHSELFRVKLSIIGLQVAEPESRLAPDPARPFEPPLAV